MGLQLCSPLHVDLASDLDLQNLAFLLRQFLVKNMEHDLAYLNYVDNLKFAHALHLDGASVMELPA